MIPKGYSPTIDLYIIHYKIKYIYIYINIYIKYLYIQYTYTSPLKKKHDCPAPAGLQLSNDLLRAGAQPKQRSVTVESDREWR